jgi:hypothetical protein
MKPTKWLLHAICITLLLPVIGHAREKDRLDAEVRRLCAIDGGVHVYETVALPPEQFDEHDNVHLPFCDSASSDTVYCIRSERHDFLSGNPSMWRSTHKVVRISDGKALGEQTRYIRRGGDLPGPWHESSFMCPEIKADSPSISREGFLFIKRPKQ